MKSPEDLRDRNIGENDQIVVEKDDAEELLPGWKKEVKVRKMGSRTKTDRYYTDPVTGYTFRSFKDVQRYLKTGEVGKLAIKPKANTKIDGTCFSENSSGSLNDVNLPDAGRLEEREEKSASKEQMMVPSPVSETSRHKRPLEYGSEGYKTRSKSSEPSKFESPQRASKRLAGVDAPPLSTPEPKTRQATKLAGIKIEAFDAPSPSPPEPKTRQATRLAGIKTEAPPPPTPPEPKSRHATQLAGIKTEAPPPPTPPEPKSHHATQLAGIKTEAPTPPEPKTRHATQLAGIKLDASPPSLLVPKTRQARRLAGMEIDASPPSLPEPKSRPARRLLEMETNASPPPSPPEPKTRQATRLAGTEVGASPLSPPEPKTRQATRLSGTGVGALPLPPPPPEPKTRQATRLAVTEIGAPPPPEPKTRKATRLAGMEIDSSPLSLPEPKTRKATRLAGNRIGASPPPLPEPKTRHATRLAGIKTDSPSEPRTSCQDTIRRAKEAETRKTVNLGATPKEIEKIAEVEKKVECVGKITEKQDGNAGMDNKPNRKQEISILSPPTTQESREKIKKDDFKANEKQEFVFSPKQHNKEIEMGPAALPPASQATPKEQVPPTVVPPVGLGIQTDDKHHGKQVLPPVVNSSVNNPILQDGNAKPESSAMNFCLNDFWTDPCIEFAVKTLTGAIPFGDLNKADNFAATPLEVPLEELWTDPCIEFAVKTLTGAIPVGEENYLQHQPSSSRSENRSVQSFSLPDVGMNFCQTEVLSKHFETVHNKQQQQQDSVGNGVLQKPGVGQGSSSNINNGQCSRARFF
ncbi:hypothetical protein L6452_05157 [Arctium lappa]|uniref:Uncharacterized protein n=1 Tax=Arctium lappa TaxID=4217 RepID=A0ACB9EFY0_ARCLA|nr:hypothetical protein L6452_05157 [Arctium lappa]